MADRHYRTSYHATSPHALYSIKVDFSDHPKLGPIYGAELITDDPDHDDVGVALYYDQGESLLRLYATFKDYMVFTRPKDGLVSMIDEAFDGIVDQLAADATRRER